MRTRARRALLWTALAFAAGQLAIGAAISRVPEWHEPAVAPVVAELGRRWTPGEPLIVMLGSSRSKNGFHAAEVERSLSDRCGQPVRAANLAVSGGGPFTSLLVLKRLLNDGYRPSLVLVDVTPPFLSTTKAPVEHRNDKLHVRHLRPGELSQVARFRNTWAASEWADWLAAWSVPAYSFRTELFLSFASAQVPGSLTEPPSDAWGWMSFPCGDDTPATRQRREEATLKAYAERLKGYELGGPNVAALEELLGFCRQQSLPTRLVMTPEAPEFQALYSPVARAQLDALLARLPTEYGLRLIDARNWYVRKDFVDYHHLHPAKAAPYTKRLVEEALSPDDSQLAQMLNEHQQR